MTLFFATNKTCSFPLVCCLFFSGQMEVLQEAGKCREFNPVPMVKLQDVLLRQADLKKMFAGEGRGRGAAAAAAGWR